MIGFPKGPTRKQAKAKRVREETRVKRAVRARCVARDGYCRLAKDCCARFGDCGGPSEWAHLLRRSASRGMDPAARHAPETSLMLCKVHHGAFDAHEIDIYPVSRTLGCEGRIAYVDRT